jgi:hypothetical protein
VVPPITGRVPPLWLRPGTNAKVTVLPLRATPVLSVTLTVRILLCPAPSTEGDPVKEDICRPDGGPPVLVMMTAAAAL